MDAHELVTEMQRTWDSLASVGAGKPARMYIHPEQTKNAELMALLKQAAKASGFEIHVMSDIPYN